jgi:outer membrane protein OmpA-like peptidoglycan-associated protein
MASLRNAILAIATCGALLLTGCAQSPSPHVTAPSLPEASCFECSGPLEYLIFFDWNSAQLTPKADKTIARFLSDSKTFDFKEIYVSGHTDSSGADPYNLKLSFKRAQAVANQLIAGGIPKDNIKVFAYGEAHMLVPTLPNTRTPQNRRVEIFGYPPATTIPAQPYHTGPIKVIRLKNGIMI